MAGKRKTKRRWTLNRGTVLILSVFALIVIVAMGSNVRKLMRLGKQKSDLERQIAAKEEEAKDLDEVLKKKDEKTNIENRARQLLGLYYPDEKLVIPIDNKGKLVEARKFEQNPENDLEIDSTKVFRLDREVPKPGEEDETFE